MIDNSKTEIFWIPEARDSFHLFTSASLCTCALFFLMLQTVAACPTACLEDHDHRHPQRN